MNLIEAGDANRTVNATDMNLVSSRSHTVLIVQVVQKDENERCLSGRLCLVDLAGSERVGKTNAEGLRLEEANSIN